MASRLRVAALGLALAVSVAGCVSIGTGGAVLNSTVTQGPGGQSQRYLQIVPQPPVNGWSPQEVVIGFLLASASFGDQQQTTLEYLTPEGRTGWRKRPSPWTAIVYSKGPNVNKPVLTAKQHSVTVTVSGTVQANLTQSGSYAVPSASALHQAQTQIFQLEKVGGQWRISYAPPELLLSSYLFGYDYQLRDLYFFDPTNSFLVPDPVYVPLQETPVDLLKGLVKDLITQSTDWLSGGTVTAFPVGTSITDVSVNGGTATVNLAIPPKELASQKQDTIQQQVSAQLLYTLSGSGQGGSVVQSVELSVNGTLWSPPDSQANPVQQLAQAKKYRPPGDSGSKYYYLDGGYLLEHDVATGATVPIEHLDKGYSQIAVSPGPLGSQDVAALTLKGSMLYAGPLHGRLTRQRGSGYQTMSWDRNGNLWAITDNGNGIVMLPAGDGPGQPLGQPVNVDVVNAPIALGQFTALRVAPDGVRVAMIVNGTDLNFGAIVPPQPSSRASQASFTIDLSPFYVSQLGSNTFDAVTWYGADDVITLGEPNAVLTEYPVNGGSSTGLSSLPNIASIAASGGYPLVAGLVKGGVTANATLTGAWPSAPIIKKAISPVYPG